MGDGEREEEKKREKDKEETRGQERNKQMLGEPAALTPVPSSRTAAWWQGSRPLGHSLEAPAAPLRSNKITDVAFLPLTRPSPGEHEPLGFPRHLFLSKSHAMCTTISFKKKKKERKYVPFSQDIFVFTIAPDWKRHVTESRVPCRAAHGGGKKSVSS